MELYAPFAGIAVDRLTIDVAHDAGQRGLIFGQCRCIGQIAGKKIPERENAKPKDEQHINGATESAIAPQSAEKRACAVDRSLEAITDLIFAGRSG